jgi:hypothetical protein
VKVFTANDCSPEFVELQYRSFEKYLHEPFEFFVFNCDQSITKTPDKSAQVNEVCRSLGIQVIEIPRDREIEQYRLSLAPGESLFNSDGRFIRGIGGDTFNYMLQWIWTRYFPLQQEQICFCHSDVFLIEPIRLSDYLVDYSLCAPLSHKETGQAPRRDGLQIGTGAQGEHDLKSRHSTINYLWEAFMLADLPKLPDLTSLDWWPNVVEGIWTDTGGRTHYWLKEHPEIKLLEVGQSGCHDDASLDFHPSRYSFFHLGDKKILHYYSGSRWCTNMGTYWNFTKEQSEDYHARKLEWTRRMIGL